MHVDDIHQRAHNPSQPMIATAPMRIALALKAEDDEVSVSSNEVLEAHIANVRASLNELKDHFRMTVAKIDHDIKADVLRLEGRIHELCTKFDDDIRRTAEDAKKNVERLAARFDTQFQELRAENRSLREKLDGNREVAHERIEEASRRRRLERQQS